jgi:hypothetical protein
MNVVCVLKSKDSLIYSAEWVYKLQRAVERNLSIPHRFVCFSDTELNCENITLEENFNGWWNKVQLFNPSFFLGETLYFDLDVIITKPLDELINKLRNSSTNFFMCKEPTGVANSSIMYWKSPIDNLYELYKNDPELYHKKYKTIPLIGDQAFISENYNHNYIESFLPEGYISWTDSMSLNLNPTTGLIVFTSIKSKPSKRIFINDPIIKQHWI